MQKHTLRRLQLLFAAFASEWIYAADAAQDAEQVQLEEVVVTGERTNRSGFETATSNRVFTTPNIDRSGHNLSATDLLKQTVNTVDLGNGNDLPTVRGVDGSGPAVGAVAFFAGTRPRLNLSIDGRSATYNEFAFGTQSLWDMQQVEVLRGPQSHVRGQNAVAGAMVMRSKDPTDEWEGALRLDLGNQKTRNVAGVVDVAVSIFFDFLIAWNAMKLVFVIFFQAGFADMRTAAVEGGQAIRKSKKTLMATSSAY